MTLEARQMYRSLLRLSGIRSTLLPGCRAADARAFAAAVAAGDPDAVWRLQVAFCHAFCEGARHFAVKRAVAHARTARTNGARPC